MLADVATITALGCHPIGIVTAQTVQNIHSATAVIPTDPKLLDKQLNHLFIPYGTSSQSASSPTIAAVKIGLLPNIAIAKVIAKHILPLKIPIVLDPVIRASSGTLLMQEDPLSIIQTLASPDTILTPNIPELLTLYSSAQSASKRNTSNPSTIPLRRWGLSSLRVKGDRPLYDSSNPSTIPLRRWGLSSLRTRFFRLLRVDEDCPHYGPRSEEIPSSPSHSTLSHVKGDRPLYDSSNPSTIPLRRWRLSSLRTRFFRLLRVDEDCLHYGPEPSQSASSQNPHSTPAGVKGAGVKGACPLYDCALYNQSVSLQAQSLARSLPCRAIIVTGGHAPNDEAITTIIAKSDNVTTTQSPRIAGGHKVRGTGCRFSSALASHLSHHTQEDLITVVDSANNTVAAHIKSI